MADAASEIRNAINGDGDGEVDVVNCGVLCDGTWQKRGYSSQNGCVAVLSIDSGKVLDAEAMSQACKQCQLHSHLDKDSEEYLTWRADHNNCKANYKGSSPAMELEGTDRIFKISVEIHKLLNTLSFMEMVIARATNKWKMSTLKMASKLSKKSVSDMFKNEWALH